MEEYLPLQRPGEMPRQCECRARQTQSHAGARRQREDLLSQSEPLLHLPEQYSVHSKWELINLFCAEKNFMDSYSRNYNA